MQPKSTLKKFKSFIFKIFTLSLIVVLSTQFSFAQRDNLSTVNSTSNNDAGLTNQQANPAGVLILNNPEAICQSLTGSLGAGDPTMTARMNRPGGAPSGNCSTPYVCPGPFGSAGYFYDTHTYTNTTGLTQCGTFTLSTTDLTNANIAFGIYNGSFDPNNLCANLIAVPNVSTGTPANNIVLNATINAGQTIVFAIWSANGSTTPAGTASNYTVTIDFPICSSAPCSGTPAPGNTVTSGANPICPNINFTLSAQNPTSGSGVTYQWQSAPGVGGPWTNISGATNPTYTTSLTTTGVAFRVQVTCSGNTGTSNPLMINLNPPSACYCAAGANDLVDEKISRVQFNTIDNPSTSQAGYENFLNISTTVIAGGTYPITVSVSNFFTGDSVRIWIDLNQNGSFTDPGELFYTGRLGTSTNFGGNITIPVSATVGNTRMRIRLWWNPSNPNPGPCGNTAYGQVEDYTLNIAPCIQGVFTTQPTNKSAQCGSDVTFNAVAAGSLLNYQWEYRTSSSSPTWLNVPNAAPYSGVNTNTLTITNTPTTLNGYQYRLVIVGPCTATDFSNAATLTVTPLVATVTPASATICTGTIVPLSITNVLSAPPPTSTAFPSGALALNVPDNTPNGVNHSIPVTLPGGSVILGASVTVNMTHTWDGDMVFVLRAPNGQIFNLDWYLSGTGGSGPTTGFTNTVISSTGTAALSSGSNPYTGTFAADAATGGGTFPSGPTGFLPTVNTWGGLYSVPNGNWTLAMYDGGPGDLGVLTSWTLTLTYTAPTFATGVWSASPSSPNSMFTDPAATVPYTGTPMTTIYVKPTVSTVYSVVVTTPTPCISGPTNVPVNVVNPVSAVVQPTNKSVCVGGNTSFSVSASGGPIAYQWQVSTNGGATYSNVGGATSATLALSGVTQSMNNYLYRCVLTAAPCPGSTTTNAALLTVNPLPTVTLAANPSSVKPGTTTTINVTSNPAGATYSWTFNGSALTGVTGSSYIANVDGIGSYTVTVTDVNGCVNTSAPYAITGQQDDRLFIYPNPAPDGQFQVRLYSGIVFDYRKINIYNSGGQRIVSREIPTTGPWQKMEFNLGNAASGVYIVEVLDRYDTKLAAGKVVIQR